MKISVPEMQSILESKKVNNTDKLIYLALCYFRSSRFGCYVNPQTLSDLLGISERSVYNNLKNLVENQFLFCEKIGKRNHYFFSEEEREKALKHCNDIEPIVNQHCNDSEATLKQPRKENEKSIMLSRGRLGNNEILKYGNNEIPNYLSEVVFSSSFNQNIEPSKQITSEPVPTEFEDLTDEEMQEFKGKYPEWDYKGLDDYVIEIKEKIRLDEFKHQKEIDKKYQKGRMTLCKN